MRNQQAVAQAGKFSSTICPYVIITHAMLIYRGGPVSIMTRGRGRGDMTGKFAAAAGGRPEAYQPAQPSRDHLLSALGGGRPQHPSQSLDERSGPKHVHKQAYNSMPPPPELLKQDATPSYRGRGRGGRGGLGFAGGQSRGGHAFRGHGHILGQANGQNSTNGEASAQNEAAANGHNPTSARGTFRGRGRGGQTARGGSKPAAAGPAPAPVL